MSRVPRNIYTDRFVFILVGSRSVVGVALVHVSAAVTSLDRSMVKHSRVEGVQHRLNGHLRNQCFWAGQPSRTRRSFFDVESSSARWK